MNHVERIQASLAAFCIPEDREKYFDLYAPNVVMHGVPGIGPGVAGLQAHYGMIWKAFPDGAVRAEALLESGNFVTVRFVFTGTQKGDFMGFPASGRSVEVPGITILRFEEGVCVERWTLMDSMLLARQIGMIPAPA